jgi:DNA polymerase III subunit gamma/tau
MKTQIPLPLKYRPLKYEDIVGQDIFVRFLRNLSLKQIGRNLVLYGSWGSGKTSSGRIYAKSLNCLNLSPEGNPCYTCDACKDNSSIIELDAASFSGKEDVKNLLDAAKAPPLIGKYKIVIADEAQQFSKAAWDTLLKSIEEPKDFQVFIFSTTELDKVRDAIKSRCQCLEVKLLNSETAKKHLKKICRLEEIKYEEQALDIIAFMSKGHPRDLLKNLEQVSFLGDITFENTKIIFNLGYITHLLTLVSKIINRNTKSFRDSVMSFEDNPKAISEVLKQFHLYLFNFCINKLHIEINPAFALIPTQDISTLWKKYEEVLCGDISGNFIKIMSNLNSMDTSSITAFEIELLNLHTFIHVKEFDITRKEISPAVTNINTAYPKKKKGRQFVTLQNNPLIPVEQEQIPEPKEQKIYPRTLLQHGFKRIELKSEEDLIFVSEENTNDL